MKRIEDRQPDTPVEKLATPTDPITITAIRDLQGQIPDTRKFEKEVGITPLELIEQIRSGKLSQIAIKFLEETRKDLDQ